MGRVCVLSFYSHMQLYCRLSGRYDRFRELLREARRERGLFTQSGRIVNWNAIKRGRLLAASHNGPNTASTESKSNGWRVQPVSCLLCPATKKLSSLCQTFCLHKALLFDLCCRLSRSFGGPLVYGRRFCHWRRALEGGGSRARHASPAK